MARKPNLPNKKSKNKNAKRSSRPPAHNKSPEKTPHKSFNANLFGMHAVREAWLNPARAFQALYLTEKTAAAFQESLAKAHKRGLKRPPVTIIEKQALDRALPDNTVHQGIAALVTPLETFSLQDLIIRAGQKDRTCTLMLDQITDPHNIGAIIRSAAAFDIDAIIVQSRHMPTLEGIAAKTACGGLEHIMVIEETNLARCLRGLSAEGFFSFGLDERGGKSIAEIKPPAHSVLVLGSEGDGLRPLVAETCDELVRLPTKPSIASLNVSNAAAIAIYEFMR